MSAWFPVSHRVHLHRDDTPLTIALLAALLGSRDDGEEIGYSLTATGVYVDWDRLTGGGLSTTEKATIHIARGCAIAEYSGLPAAVRAPMRDVLEDITR